MSVDLLAASDEFRKPPHRYIDVGGAEVAYRKVGEGPDVLFVHGWPVNSATFRRLLPFLADHVTCHLIDLPGAGSSRFDSESDLTIEGHIRSVRRVIDALDLRSVSVVGHDSGGLIARHAIAGDPRLRSLALLDTEPSTGVSWKFRSFLLGRHVPGFGNALGWVAGRPRLRRSSLIFGDAFVDRSNLDGDFEEFFFRPLHDSRNHRVAAGRLLKSFHYGLIDELSSLHRRIEVPVVLVWGDEDRFFPVGKAREMLSDFAIAQLIVIPGAGLFAHEERPEEVARAILPTLLT